MRNAPVAALIYEFLFRVYNFYDYQQQHTGAYPKQLPDENGVMRQSFCHEFTSCWEWSTGVLTEVGALKHLKSHYTGSAPSPFYYLTMTLDECRSADLSAYESFDNYCWLMFTFWQFDSDDISVHDWSPQFRDDVAMKDDIFRSGGRWGIIFSDERFQEKVISHWANVSTFSRSSENR